MSFFPGLQDKGMEYLHAVASANNFSVDRVEYIKKKKTKLTVHDTHQKKVLFFSILTTSLNPSIEGM